MLRLREIMTRDIVTVTPDATIREAMETLASRHVSGAPVVEGGALVGIVTAMDLLAFASSMSGVPEERDASNMTDLPAEAPAEEEVEGEEPPSAYFADYWDDAGAELPVRFASTEGPEWNVLEEHDVSEIMTRQPLATLGPDAGADQAAALMWAMGIHRVLVTEGDRLVGIVSALDVTRAAAEGRFTARTMIFDRGIPDRMHAPRGVLGTKRQQVDPEHRP